MQEGFLLLRRPGVRASGRWTRTVPGGGLLASGSEGLSETTALGVAQCLRFGNLKSFLKTSFPSAVPFPLSSWPARKKLFMHLQWLLLSPARPSGWSCSAVLGRGHSSSCLQDREVQPKCSPKGQFLSFNPELCDGRKL